MPRRIRRLVAIVLVLVLLAMTGRRAWNARRHARFVDQLHLLGFSTSLIGMCSDEEMQAKSAEADRLGVDLFAQYSKHLDDGHRFDLAYLLMVRESHVYCDFAGDHVADVPWPEARIWKMMHTSKAISAPYRDRLLKLLLACPNSEARLFAGDWYREQGDRKKSDAAYWAVIARGPSFDALDAAVGLTRSKPQRGKALQYLLADAQTERDWTPAAYRLLNVLGVRQQLEPLVDNKTRQQLLGKLKELIARDSATTLPSASGQ